MSSKGKCGIEDVRGSDAEVDPLGGRADRFRDVLQERDYVVLRLLFYLGHPDSVNLGLFRDDGQVVFRDDAKLGPRLADGDLDVEPRA